MNSPLVTPLRVRSLFNRFLPRAAFAFVLFFSSVAAAQTTGTVRGRVSNAGTSTYLDGAVVTLTPGNYSALTGSTGEFAFTNVPAGTYSLTASYTGLDAKTTQVSVGAGRESEQEIQLTSAIHQLDKFVVAGEREGNAAAITQQRNADNVKNVMASDAFGNVADLNIGKSRPSNSGASCRLFLPSIWASAS